MTAHELALKLLIGPNLPIIIRDDDSVYVTIEPECQVIEGDDVVMAWPKGEERPKGPFVVIE